MSQLTPTNQYPAIIRAAGSAAMQHYDTALAAIRSEGGDPAKLLDDHICRIIAAIYGHGTFPAPPPPDDD